MDDTVPDKPYTDVESAFIRDKIASGSFEDEAYREYVNDLVQLEVYIQGSVDSFGAGYHFGRLRNRYPDEYDAIQRELDPETFRERKRREGQRPSIDDIEEGEPDDAEIAAAADQWEAVKRQQL